MRSAIKNLLQSYGVYERLNYSPAYEFYLRLARREHVKNRQREVSFYRRVLNGITKRALIFDVGASSGTKTDVFLRLAAGVVCVEPDRKSLDILESKFRRRRDVSIVRKAVSETIGMAELHIQEDGSAYNTLSNKWSRVLSNNQLSRFGELYEFSSSYRVETTTLDNLIDEFGIPFFIKLDVEGFEVNAIRGLTRSVPYVSFELNLPEFRAEGLECLARLQQIGDRVAFNYITDINEGLKHYQWLDFDRFRSFLQNTDLRYVEVFCRTQIADPQG